MTVFCLLLIMQFAKYCSSILISTLLHSASSKPAEAQFCSDCSQLMITSTGPAIAAHQDSFGR